MSAFSIEFNYHGRRQTVTIHAADWAEAERKLWMLKANGEVAGKIMLEIPIKPRFWGWLKWLIR